MRAARNEIIDIPSATEEKDLGIIFEKSLKFNKHILNVVNRCKKLTGIVRRSFRYMNKILWYSSVVSNFKKEYSAHRKHSKTCNENCP